MTQIKRLPNITAPPISFGMISFVPILLAALYGLAMYRFSAQQTAKDMDANSAPLADPALLRQTALLAQALDLPRIPVRVYASPAINGLAAADGQVYLTQGFIDKYHQNGYTPQETASVIAHELGHVALNHSKRRMVEFGGQNAMRSMLGLVMGRFIPFVGPMVANHMVTLFSAKLSREDEFEADAFATSLMIKAGIDVDAQITILQKMNSAAPKARPVWTASHPQSTDRIARIRRNRDAWLR